MEILWYRSLMSADMFKKQLSLLVRSGYIRDEGRLHEEKPGLSSLPTWHTCSVRENGPNGTNSGWDVARFRESSFSKTLISGPQISCQSSVLHRHRIREKAVPYKSTTCQSHAHTDMCSWHKRVNNRRQMNVWTQTHTLRRGNVSYFWKPFLL